MPNNTVNGRTKKNLSWDAVELAVDKACDWIESTLGDKVSIYGIPRGGMIPAVMVCHKLESRGLQVRFAADLNHLLPTELHKLVIIDEICDSGDTFKVIKELFPIANTVVLFQRGDAKFAPDFYSCPIVGDNWLTFPWEVSS